MRNSRHPATSVSASTLASIGIDTATDTHARTYVHTHTHTQMIHARVHAERIGTDRRGRTIDTEEHRHRHRRRRWPSISSTDVRCNSSRPPPPPTPLPPLDCLIGSHYVGTIIIIQGFFTAVPQSARALARGPVTPRSVKGGHARRPDRCIAGVASYLAAFAQLPFRSQSISLEEVDGGGVIALFDRRIVTLIDKNRVILDIEASLDRDRRGLWIDGFNLLRWNCKNCNISSVLSIFEHNPGENK